ncbi:MAG: glycosyl transferase group 1 [uncultured bacterium]|nr:MAG: glycosyl transferase group 1 [uncultured bacterium]
MRIALFTNNYLPNPYGVSSSIESFRVEFEKMGHTVYIFAPHFKGYVDENPNVFRYPAIEITLRGVRYPIAIPFSYKISRILKNLEIDVIHAQHPNLLGWVAKRWAKKKKIPLIFTWHTLYDRYAHFVPLVPTAISAWWSISNAKRFANKANYVVVPTPSVKKIIQDWGVTNKNIIAIPSGIEEGKFIDPNGVVIKDKFEIKKDDFVILLVSRLTAEKNVEFIFDSLIPILKAEEKIKFLVVGGGNKRKDLEKNVIENSLSAQILFGGEVGQKEIKNYYAAADIFVYASKSETQGMILTEAMYMGLPIVALRAPGVRDMVGNFITGILIKENKNEFSSAVLKLMKDGELRKQYSDKSKLVAFENYTAKVCAKKLLQIYNEKKSK